MGKLSVTAQEKVLKEKIVIAVMEALNLNGFEAERITDLGTLAMKVGTIEGKDRYMTVKLVLNKAFDDEKGEGFDINEATFNYADRLEQDEKKAIAKSEKDAKALADKARREAEKIATKEAKEKAANKIEK